MASSRSRVPPALEFATAAYLYFAAPPRRGCSSSRRSRTSCWSTARLRVVLPNVRANATREAWRLGAAQDNGACDCPARRQGAMPHGVAC